MPRTGRDLVDSWPFGCSGALAPSAFLPPDDAEDATEGMLECDTPSTPDTPSGAFERVRWAGEPGALFSLSGLRARSRLRARAAGRDD
jgi:hypothetical protein